MQHYFMTKDKGSIQLDTGLEGQAKSSDLMPAIEMRNVTVELGGSTILKNVSIKVMHGETLVIMGPSGGGKTVLIKTMAGIFSPTSGQVFCEGEDWRSLQSDAKHDLARKIGVQFQRTALFDNLTVWENVAFPIREHHPELTAKEIQIKIENCLDSVNLLESQKLMPHELSGGMKQRLAIARAIVLEPEIVFYDDPTAGLDPINSDKMADLILALKEKNNSTLIVVTHDILRAYQMAQRIVLVANQEIIETGTPEETRNHPDPRVQQFINGELDGPLNWS